MTRAMGYVPMRPVSADSADAYARVVEAERRRARDLTVARNQGLVYAAVRRYRVALVKAQGLDESDLIQAGLMGLAVAAERFDPSRGVAFSTYSMHWVRHHISRTLSNHARTVRIPCHALQSGHSGVPTVSLNAPIDDDRALGDTLPAPEPADDEPNEATLRARLGELLPTIEPRLALVVRMRLAGRTLKEVGTELGVCRERARQLEAMAVEALRRALAKRSAS